MFSLHGVPKAISTIINWFQIVVGDTAQVTSMIPILKSYVFYLSILGYSLPYLVPQ